MANAAVAVCETLSFFGLRPCIKWVNDVYVDDKKICGILIENVFRGGNVSSSVVGIGLNVNNRLPQELQGIATTMEQALGRPCLVKDVEEKLITELEKDRAMSDYIERVGYLGREATLIFGDERVHGVLLSVDEEGGLWVKIGDKKRRLTAAEVSVQL